jgi:hypothetical protein
LSGHLRDRETEELSGNPLKTSMVMLAPLKTANGWNYPLYCFFSFSEHMALVWCLVLKHL